MAKFTLQPPKVASIEPEVDPTALDAFAAGARDRRGAGEEVPPWEKFDPTAKPRYSVSLRLNDHYMAMLHYLAATLDMSQHKLLSKQLLPALKQLALERFEAQRKEPK